MTRGGGSTPGPPAGEETALRAAEPNLLRAIAARARRSSDGALVACALAGLVAAGGLLWMEGRGWGVLLPLVGVGAYGAWGVLDRALDERLTLRRTGAPPALTDHTLVASRAIVAVLGVAIVGATVLALLGMLLGKIIS